MNKGVWSAVSRCGFKSDRMIYVHFQDKSFNITVIQVYVPTSNTEKPEVEWVHDNLQDLLELTPKKTKKEKNKQKKNNNNKKQTPGCPFHRRGLECKISKSRDTWSNRQVWPCSTKWSRAKAKRVLQREHTGHSKYSLPTIQELTLNTLFQQYKRWLYIWTSSDDNTKIRLIIFFAVKDGEALYS